MVSLQNAGAYGSYHHRIADDFDLFAKGVLDYAFKTKAQQNQLNAELLAGLRWQW